MHTPELHTGEICLESPRLWLRSMRAGDLDDLHIIFADPNVMDAFEMPPFTRQQMQQWLQRNLDHQRAHGFGLFSLLLKTDGTLVGNCGLEIMKVDGEEVAELGYDLRSDYWNQGLATEAASTVRDFAFQRLCLPKLISLIREGNVRSRRVAEKVGLHYVSNYAYGPRTHWKYALERAACLRQTQAE